MDNGFAPNQRESKPGGTSLPLPSQRGGLGCAWRGLGGPYPVASHPRVLFIRLHRFRADDSSPAIPIVPSVRVLQNSSDDFPEIQGDTSVRDLRFALREL